MRDYYSRMGEKGARRKNKKPLTGYALEELKRKNMEEEKNEKFKNNNLFPCPYSKAVTCVLTDPCKGCDTFAKYLVGEETSRMQSIETENFYPDLSKIREDLKEKALKEIVNIAAFPLLSAFLSFGLKTHIETMIVNDKTKEEYVLTFETASRFRERLKLSGSRQQEPDKTAEEWIRDQWGEAWLRNKWSPSDVRVSLEEYAEYLASKNFPSDCEHPYAFVDRTWDYEKCTKCGKVLCEG